ncbi:Homoserine/homoserine lactone efflux protein [Serratia sp. Tan611]|nr:Homoserine/homoserine lactone efflux protein [Serratia sp. Tan611]
MCRDVAGRASTISAIRLLSPLFFSLVPRVFPFFPARERTSRNVPHTLAKPKAVTYYPSSMDINLPGFIPALLPVALSPGASFTLAMNGALADGRQGLLRTLLGTALGIYTHALLIGLGVTAVLAASPAAFGVLKIAGNLYLLWLGIQLIRSGVSARRLALNNGRGSVTLKSAWLLNVLNPKAIMFYLTVVSQFAGRHGELGNYLLLASVHIAVMSVWLIAVSYALVFSARKADPLTLKKYINIGGGMLLVFFSLFSLIY